MSVKSPLSLALFSLVLEVVFLNAQTPTFNQEQQKAIQSKDNRAFPTDEELRPRMIKEEIIKKTEKESTDHLKETVVDPLQGIWIGSENEKRKVEPGIGTSLSLKSKEKLTKKLKPFLKNRLTFQGLKQIRETIETYFEEEENRTIRAVTPDQEATHSTCPT